MAKVIIILLIAVVVIDILLPATSLASTTTSDKVVYRRKRFLFGGWNFPFFGGGRPPCGGPGDCPPHHCSRDDAVIHGFCCGCAKLGDRVPVPCPGFLQCPLSPEPLCSDYNYMMDCCC